jgi:TPR repeat protein
LTMDPDSSSSNLDYLLEDEEPKRSGAGKFALILLMLALAGGFGYLRWKWLQLGQIKRPAAATSQTPDPSATTYDLPGTGDNSASATPPPAQPARPAPQAAPDAASSNPPPADTHAKTPDAGNDSSPKSEAPSPNDTSNSSPDSSAANESAAKEPAAEPAPSDTASEPAPKPKRPAAEPQPKPHAGITPTSSADAVAEAQRYIYGRGVTQDCERGMRLLKPAAAQANPKAMVEMGALYSAGLCTPHDLPTAYRWFAMALRKDPDNQSVQADLQKLWGEMTQPERQLAIKLSQ